MHRASFRGGKHPHRKVPHARQVAAARCSVRASGTRRGQERRPPFPRTGTRSWGIGGRGGGLSGRPPTSAEGRHVRRAFGETTPQERREGAEGLRHRPGAAQPLLQMSRTRGRPGRRLPRAGSCRRSGITSERPQESTPPPLPGDLLCPHNCQDPRPRVREVTSGTREAKESPARVEAGQSPTPPIDLSEEPEVGCSK